MGLRFIEGMTIADLVTLSNGALGFLAIVIAPSDPQLAARLILIAAVADGIDGVLARRMGGSPIGPYLDSLSDVASFAIAPAVLVYVTVQDATITGVPEFMTNGAIILVPMCFVVLAILRLGCYSVYDTTRTETIGAPTTLAATILAAGLLTAYATAPVVLFGTGVLAVAMVSPIEYPDLLARDALIMGGIHIFAVLFPTLYGRVFVYALVTLALAYAVLAPWLYWGEDERQRSLSSKGKRS